MSMDLVATKRASTPRHITPPASPSPQGAAFIVGVIQGSKWGLSAVPSNVVMAYLVLSVLSTVTHLRTFTTFRTVQVRARACLCGDVCMHVCLRVGGVVCWECWGRLGVVEACG